MSEIRFDIFPKAPIVLAILILLTSVAYAPIFMSNFTYDGRLVVGDNPVVAAPGSWRLLFSSKYFDAFGEDSYRPVNTATYMIDARIYGISKTGFGFTSVFLHSLSGFALFIILRRRISPNAAFLASALFVTHPAISEAVYCVGHRESILGGLFVFLCIAINDLAMQKRKYADAILYSTFVFGLFAIESVILAPAYIIAESVLSKKNLEKKNLTRAIILLLIGGAFFVLRPWWFVAPGKTVEWFGGSFAASMVHGVGAFFTYLRLLALPVALRPDYGQSPFAIQSFSFWAGLVSLVVAAGVIISKRSNPPVKTLVAWILISLAPFLHLFLPFWISLAERYLFIAAACFSAIMALWISHCFTRSKKCAYVITVVVIACFGAGSFHRGLSHKDDLSLWTGAVKAQPDSIIAWANLAQAQLQFGDREGRKKTLQHILQIDPGNEKASVNLSNIYWDLGRKEKAVEVLENSAEIHPESALVLEALGIDYLKNGLFDEAHELFVRMRRIEGGRLPAARSMARLHFVRRNMEELIESLSDCAEIDPLDAICLQIQGILLMEAGKHDLAFKRFQACADNAQDEELKRVCAMNRDKSSRPKDENDGHDN